ncbi:TonB C-terminal domain-containing protein [Rhodocyclus tenuis]|uniref:TonB C-terminal domain-containing protein n=1 Tax=Rhodocyclus tenuis TaxID=1066 RepID=UPI001904E326|nr:TonB C-terminal domain-containing protein [Rhodocyclus tenuis]MBK1678950.1 TonB-dependent receptor [Rhodocyclus tenuis]
MSGLAEDDIESAAGSRWLRIAAGAVLLLAAVGIVTYLLKGLGDSGPVAKKQVTKISVLPDTPPPPPPPPPKEQPKETKEMKQEQPKPVEQPQQAEPLKMEGAAGAGESPFAAGQVSRDYIGGTPGNGGGMQFAFFSNALQRHVQDELARNRKIKLGDYRVQVNLWIGKDGSISRAELASSSGNADTDRALRTALSELGPIRTAVPDNLPQPIKLRITNRMTG